MIKLYYNVTGRKCRNKYHEFQSPAASFSSNERWSRDEDTLLIKYYKEVKTEKLTMLWETFFDHFQKNSNIGRSSIALKRRYQSIDHLQIHDYQFWTKEDATTELRDFKGSWNDLEKFVSFPAHIIRNQILQLIKSTMKERKKEITL